MGVEGQAVSAGGNMLGAGLAIATDEPNRRKSASFYDPDGSRGTGYNPDAASFGGRPNGRAEYSANINYRRGLVEGRTANRADYGDAQADRNANAQARYGMQREADQMAMRASGQLPSIAQQQADRQMGQAQAAQASMQASARGAGGMALAQQNAANNTATMQGNISGQAQVNAAQERMAASQAAAGMYGQMRSGDQGNQQMDAGQAQFQASQEQANRNANDARAMGYEGLDMNAYQAELQAKAQQQHDLAGSYNASEQANAATAQANVQRKQGMLDKFWSSISDERAKDLVDMPGTLMPGTSKKMESGAVDIGQKGSFSNADVLNASTGLGGGGIPGTVGGGGITGGRIDLKPVNGGGSDFYSDTRAKEAAILAKGQQQGIALARGGKQSDVDFIKKGYDPRARPTDAMLDDRFKQNEVGPDTVGKAALDRAIGSQVQQDRTMTAQQIMDEEYNSRTPAQKGIYTQGSSPQDDARGVAPGTSDFERTSGQPQAQQAPWWASTGGTVLSDEKTKEPASVLPLLEPEGKQLHQSDDGHAFYADDPIVVQTNAGRPPPIGGSERGSETPTPALSRGRSKAKPARAERKMTPDEMMRAANAMGDSMQSDHNARMDAGPSVMVSDERAKQAAFELGRQAGQLATRGGQAFREYTRDDGGDGPESAKLGRQADKEAQQALVSLLPGPSGGPDAARALGGAWSSIALDRDRSDALDRESKAASQASRRHSPSTTSPRNLDIDTPNIEAARRNLEQAGREKLRSPVAYHRDDPVAEANRSMVGSPYAYKPGLTPPEQTPGEVNVGPMAQNLEKSPVAATAVKTDPATGLKVIDKDKALKVVMSGVADLQRQQDETRAMMLSTGRKR